MEPGRVLGLLLCGLSAGVAAVTRPSPAPATSGWTSDAAVPLRLVDGGHRCAGRVEVKHEGEWGSVCAYDFDWDARGAGVVCRQLGCGAAVRASPFAPFGQGEGRIWLHPFNCRGTEAALQDCYNFGWGRHFCSHEWDVGVTCAEALELRLAAGGGPCAGRVEVKLRGRWGTVADGAWSVEDAEVVCRQLGCGSAAGAYHGSKFGPAEGPINLVVVQCRGDEPALWNCSIQGWGPYDGHHDHDVAVVCQAYAGIRLADGGSPCAGRVEVEERGTWRPLCAESWELPDAHVLCRHLGCGPAVSVHPGGHFGVGKGPPRRDVLGCVGNERHPSECPAPALGEPACLPGHAAAVTCSGAVEPLRLRDGESRCDGRLEVALSPGRWTGVSAGSRDDATAAVACRQLACGVPEKVYAASGGGSDPTELRCEGGEEFLERCNASGPGARPGRPRSVLAVACSGSRRLRLAGGPGRCAGRVEVYSEGAWGSACRNNWTLRDADVVCRQLRCGSALEAPGPERFGSGTGTPWAGAGGCAGTEEALWDCPARRGCGGGGGAGAVCSALRALRLAGGGCEGLLELLRDGTWGRVCADGVVAGGTATAVAVCRQLGCGAGGTLRNVSDPGSGPAWLGSVRCDEGARSLWRCPSAPWLLQSCGPAGVTYVACAEAGSDANAAGSPAPAVTGGGVPLPVAPVPVVLCALLGTLLSLALAALALQARRARARRAGPSRDAGSEAVYEELDYCQAPECREGLSRAGSVLQGSGLRLSPHLGDEEEGIGTAEALGAEYDDATAVPEETLGETGYDDVDIGAAGTSP